MKKLFLIAALVFTIQTSTVHAIAPCGPMTQAEYEIWETKRIIRSAFWSMLDKLEVSWKTFTDGVNQ